MSNLQDTYDDLNDALEEAEEWFHDNYPGIKVVDGLANVGFVVQNGKWALCHRDNKGE